MNRMNRRVRYQGLCVIKLLESNWYVTLYGAWYIKYLDSIQPKHTSWKTKMIGWIQRLNTENPSILRGIYIVFVQFYNYSVKSYAYHAKKQQFTFTINQMFAFSNSLLVYPWPYYSYQKICNLHDVIIAEFLSLSLPVSDNISQERQDWQHSDQDHRQQHTDNCCCLVTVVVPVVQCCGGLLLQLHTAVVAIILTFLSSYL